MNRNTLLGFLIILRARGARRCRNILRPHFVVPICSPGFSTRLTRSPRSYKNSLAKLPPTIQRWDIKNLPTPSGLLITSAIMLLISLSNLTATSATGAPKTPTHHHKQPLSLHERKKGNEHTVVSSSSNPHSLSQRRRTSRHPRNGSRSRGTTSEKLEPYSIDAATELAAGDSGSRSGRRRTGRERNLSGADVGVGRLAVGGIRRATTGGASHLDETGFMKVNEEAGRR